MQKNEVTDMEAGKDIKDMVEKIRNGLLNVYCGPAEIIDLFLAGVITRSNILLTGACGKGKSFLCEAAAKFLNCSFSRVQGGQGLTESKMIATYDIAQLMQGKEVVLWRDFCSTKFRMFDEINRCHPTVINSTFSMLAEGIIIYGNHRIKVGDAVFVATMNPDDSGTYQMSPPFLDRFHFTIPMPSVKANFKEKMSKIQGIQLKPVLEENEIDRLWKYADSITIPENIKFSLANMVRTLQLCQNGEKEFLTNFPGICKTCRFSEFICAKIEPASTISERVYISALKILKGYAVIHYNRPLQIQDLINILPYVLLQRIKFVDSFEKENFNKINAVKALVNELHKKEIERERFFEIISELKPDDKAGLQNLESWAKNDLLLKEYYDEIKR
ncbi:MAG: MoxR family ATPase [Elusimicrobiota bacterium]